MSQLLFNLLFISVPSLYIDPFYPLGTSRSSAVTPIVFIDIHMVFFPPAFSWCASVCAGMYSCSEPDSPSLMSSAESPSPSSRSASSRHTSSRSPSLGPSGLFPIFSQNSGPSPPTRPRVARANIPASAAPVSAAEDAADSGAAKPNAPSYDAVRCCHLRIQPTCFVRIGHS